MRVTSPTNVTATHIAPTNASEQPASHAWRRLVSLALLASVAAAAPAQANTVNNWLAMGAAGAPCVPDLDPNLPVEGPSICHLPLGLTCVDRPGGWQCTEAGGYAEPCRAAFCFEGQMGSQCWGRCDPGLACTSFDGIALTSSGDYPGCVPAGEPGMVCLDWPESLVEGGSCYDDDALCLEGQCQTVDAVTLKYYQLPDAGQILGAPLTDVAQAPDGEGLFQHFQYGSIYWHPSVGAHEVHGRIRDRWALLGWELGPLGYPTSDESTSGAFAISRFEHGTIRHRFVEEPFTVYQQNTAMLPSPKYKGANRQASMDVLLDELLVHQPDIVGLSEVFGVGGDQLDLLDIANMPGVRDVYPFSMRGPDELDLEDGGGMVLLSRFPIVRGTETVYRSCAGFDCASNKGVLHARVRLPSGTLYDVALSHTQNPNEGGTNASRAEVQDQLTHLHSFVQANRDRGTRPAIIMGDLNTNGLDDAQYVDLMERLHWPMDAWLTSNIGPANVGHKGITSDKVRDFEADKPNIQGDPYRDPRGQSGSRIDYFLYHGGRSTFPVLDSTWLVNLQTREGRDASDHYGLRTHVAGHEEMPVTYDGEFPKVIINLRRVHALGLTTGVPIDTIFDISGIPVQVNDPDNVKWELSASFDGRPFTSDSTNIIDLDAGELRDFSFGPRVSNVSGEPVQSSVRIQLQGWEVDQPVSQDSLGRLEVTLNREDLMHAMVEPIDVGFGPFEALGGQYAAIVEVQVRRQ